MSVSFSFTKKSSNKPLVRAEDSLDETKDYVVSVEGKQIQSQNPKPLEKKKEYVVPLIKKVNWRLPGQRKEAGANKEPMVTKSEEELALDKEAAAAIRKDLEQAKNNDPDDDLRVVPLLMQNKPPIGDDSTDDKMADLELRPEESTLEDYDNMPIGQFGIACLKGMGWKKSEGIGLTNKQCVEPIEFIQRPAGQGLGAALKLDDAPKLKRTLKPGEERRKFLQPIREKNGRVRWVKTLDEEVPQEIEGYGVGAYVSVTTGPHTGLLGKIVEEESKDKEHVNVQLALNKQVVQFSVKQLKLLSIDEFKQLKEQSAVKKSRMQRYGLIKMQGEDNEDDDVICLEDTVAAAPVLHKDHPPTKDESMVVADEGHKHKKKRKHHHIEEKEPSSYSYYTHKRASKLSAAATAPTRPVSWLAPNLRVRIISKDYCKGVYYNQKVNIIDVTSLDSCMCRTDDGKLLDNLHQDSLETIVPKEKCACVMVVMGKHKHKLATVLERNSSEAIVTVQLEESKKVLTLNYDDICQCTTTVSHME